MTSGFHDRAKQTATNLQPLAAAGFHFEWSDLDSGDPDDVDACEFFGPTPAAKTAHRNAHLAGEAVHTIEQRDLDFAVLREITELIKLRVAEAANAPAMKAFEITGAFFYGGTDETDDRVIWVLAPDAETVTAAIVDIEGATFCGEMANHVSTENETEFVEDGGDFLLPRDLAKLREKLISFAQTQPEFSPETLAEMGGSSPAP